jgi:flagellum-specific ATP synthase
VTLGAYKKGSDPKLDQVLSRIEPIEAFLKQRRDERVGLDEATSQLAKLT